MPPPFGYQAPFGTAGPTPFPSQPQQFQQMQQQLQQQQAAPFQTQPLANNGMSSNPSAHISSMFAAIGGSHMLPFGGGGMGAMPGPMGQMGQMGGGGASSLLGAGSGVGATTASPTAHDSMLQLHELLERNAEEQRRVCRFACGIVHVLDYIS